jgi:predicted nucleotidyltransferase
MIAVANRNDIQQRLRPYLPQLRQRYGVTALSLFGSYSRGEQTAASDVDLLVQIDNPTLTLFQFVELRDQLTDLLGVPVDLVEQETLKPTISKRILQEAQPV